MVLVGVNGIWGERMTVLAARYGADVRTMTAEAGHVFSYADVERALQANPGTKVVFLVHGESSTGTLQPLTGLGDLCHAHGTPLAWPLDILPLQDQQGGSRSHTDDEGVPSRVPHRASFHAHGRPLSTPRCPQKRSNGRKHRRRDVQGL